MALEKKPFQISREKSDKELIEGGAINKRRGWLNSSRQLLLKDEQIEIARKEMNESLDSRKIKIEEKIKDLRQGVKEISTIFNDANMEYGLVGGFSIDLLAEKMGIKNITTPSKDIDMYTSHEGAQKLQDLGYLFGGPGGSEIYGTVFDDPCPYFHVVKPGVLSIGYDIFVTLPDLLKDEEHLDYVVEEIDGVMVRFLSPKYSYRIYSEAIKYWEAEGYDKAQEQYTMNAHKRRIERLMLLEQICEKLGIGVSEE